MQKLLTCANYSVWKSRLNLFRLGKLAYILFLIKELLTFKTFSFTLHNKDEVTDLMMFGFLLFVISHFLVEV